MIRLVLDTNVCLDLFVFNDPRWQPIIAALENQSIQAITCAECRDEWLAVLHYAHLPITEDTRADFIKRFDEMIAVENPPVVQIVLPRCTDKDDQKFLEIARDAKLEILVTKDKALLKLARKTRALGLFNIMTPTAFLQTLVPTEM
jgi:putative PIN family toxin of toxin-antitoxin system